MTIPGPRPLMESLVPPPPTQPIYLRVPPPENLVKDFLDDDLLVRILLYLTAGDLYSAALVCQAWNTAVQSPPVAKMLAERRFGSDIVAATLHFYDHDYRTMLDDDCRRGAVPAKRSALQPCYWMDNTMNRYYVCVIQEIQLHPHSVLRVYIDVRGEFDLRPPAPHSSLAVQVITAQSESVRTARGVWHGEVETAGHYRGYLEFRGAGLGAGDVRFCYANFFHSMADYQPVTILQIGSDLRASFDEYALKDQSPFAGETPEEERARMAPFVPVGVLTRTSSEMPNRDGGHAWWVD